MENTNNNNIANQPQVEPSAPQIGSVAPAPNGKPQISTPMAIIIAGALVMVGIMLSHRGSTADQPKTLSEQVGVSNAALSACIKGTDANALSTQIQASVDKAMSNYTPSERGTPYSIIVGKNGVMTDIRGAETYENTKKIIDDALAGKVTTPYKGNVALSEPSDHVQGSPNATVTIIEYSDFECPFCKQFEPVIEKIMADYPNDVKRIYRHYPLHQHSFEMLLAADCVAKLKGDPAFFKYGDLLFGLQDQQDTVSGKL